MIAASLHPETAKMCFSRVYTNILQVLFMWSKRIILTWQNKAQKKMLFLCFIQPELFISSPTTPSPILQTTLQFAQVLILNMFLRVAMVREKAIKCGLLLMVPRREVL